MNEFLKKYLPLIALGAFIIILLTSHISIILEAPFSSNTDSIIYFEKAKNIIADQGISFAGNFEAYDLTPSLFLLLAGLSGFSVKIIPYIGVLLLLLQVIFIPIFTFWLGKIILKNSWAALLVTFLFILRADQLLFEGYDLASFFLLRTSNFSFILFLLAVILAFKFFTRINTKIFYIILLTTLAMFSFHHQSGLVFWIIFYLFFCSCLYYLYRNKKIQKKYFFISLGVFIFPFIAGVIADIILGGKILETLSFLTDGLVGGYSENIDPFSLNYISYLGIVIIPLAILGLIFLIKKRKDNMFTIFFLSAYFLIIFLGIYQTLFGLQIFAERFLLLLFFPMCLLAGVFFVYIFKKSKYFFAGIGILIIIIGTVNYFSMMSQIKFNMPWPYFKATAWAAGNFDQDYKFMTDVNTLIQFRALTFNEPAFSFRRTRDLNKQNKQEPVKVIIKSEDAQTAYDYMIENNIKYFIFDTRMGPRSSPGDYNKFSDELLFQEIYREELKEGREMIIYETK
ncbi:hypothetical protein KKC88_04935 [Patescibacteria group bacterium]|nr:hypothetical protein [Patescibacteria group bacterium]MBU1673246.1 hypothetical protein [Patescibacteria group bacterium]MBU1963507.1 hypothetical protein [Patescibacteria group bacterium]